ncbi:MAG: energy-coupling factor ABC transporter permease [Muribaculaceae bacterium]|nr:energy-coupling factor ABC transporter permease [Muribaculaceae bacterium]
MHMSDGLISTPVAAVAAAGAAVLIAVAAAKVKKSTRSDLVPLTGVLGAFVFAAQMVNFAIPGTGSSGHIIGGVLLAAFLGPWAAFLALTAVLVIQCLVFADGGLLALGCNILNMAATSCLVAYPLVFRPVAGRSPSAPRIMAASVAACVVALELGALLVSAETELSGVTALSTARFLMLMTVIHLAIGMCEGLATGVVLGFVHRTRPALLYTATEEGEEPARKVHWRAVAVIALAAIVVGGGLSLAASSSPDGLEWSIEKITGSTEVVPQSAVAAAAGSLQEATAAMPDYNSTLAGIIGAAMVMLTLWGVCAMISTRSRKVKQM